MINVYRNFSQIITLKKALEKDGRFLLPEDLDVITNGSLVFSEEKILWIGPDNSLPQKYLTEAHKDCRGHIITPEIVDSHTHLVFGGDRSFEYSMRLNGACYQDIANAGGGILATMEKTITASSEELFQGAVKKINEIHAYGVGTIEIKSGYGLTFESEIKLSHVIARLKKHFAPQVQILNTFMAAHAVPTSFDNSRKYMIEVVLPLLEELHQENIIDFVDIFHENGYFDQKDCDLLFNRAKELKLKIKIHADEFNDNKGAILATKVKAVSADHLLCTGSDGILALSQSSTVATLLPGTAYFLGKPLARAQDFLNKGCKVALASDFNPGSCHCDNLLLIASVSAKSLGLNLAQLWASITLNAAHALDLKDQGALVENLKPRFSIFKASSIDQITYNWGKNLSVFFDEI